MPNYATPDRHTEVAANRTVEAAERTEAGSEITALAQSSRQPGNRPARPGCSGPNLQHRLDHLRI